jgi:hypothetical protein
VQNTSEVTQVPGNSLRLLGITSYFRPSLGSLFGRILAHISNFPWNVKTLAVDVPFL